MERSVLRTCCRADAAGMSMAAVAATALLAVSTSLALACGDSGGGSGSGALDAATADAAPRVKERTVTIELFPTAERPLEQAVDGSLAYGPFVDVGGAEVCVAKRRAAFQNFEPFEEIAPEEQICTTSVEGETVQLAGVPADSDLVITTRKAAYQPSNVTFRTDEHDVGLPAFFAPTLRGVLLREGAADPWLEPASRPGPLDGVVAIWAHAFWRGEGFVSGGPQLASEPYINVTPAEGVSVDIELPDGSAIGTFATLSTRPRFVVLREGSYRFRWSHPRMNVSSDGGSFQFYITGLGTERQDTFELQVLAGHWTVATVVALCASRAGPVNEFETLG